MTKIVVYDKNCHPSPRATQSSYPGNMLAQSLCKYVGEDLERKSCMSGIALVLVMIWALTRPDARQL